MSGEISTHFYCFQSDVTYFICRQICCPCAWLWYGKLLPFSLIHMNYHIATASLPIVSFITNWALIYPSILAFKSKVHWIQACFHICQAASSWSTRHNLLPSLHGALWLPSFSLPTYAHGSFPLKNIYRVFPILTRQVNMILSIYIWGYCFSITKLSQNLIWPFVC